MPNNSDEIFMMRSLQLAALGFGFVAPNPMVGALLVHEGTIIGEGYHHKYGEAHAEVNAIKNAPEELLANTTLYVSLEPCVHFGKTPPCVDLIIQKKIKKVVIGCLDPYRQVAGKGVQKLRENGVEIVVGVCEKECRDLNKRFFISIEKNRPFVILKYAQTADGRLGVPPGSTFTKQISNEYSQRLVHQWRSEEDAILVGTKTAIIDNPQLNARFYGNKNPVRVVIDRNLKIPFTSNLLNGLQETIVFTEKYHHSSLPKTKFIKANFKATSFIAEILFHLHQEKIQSIVVEGGTTTLQSFLDEGLWDEARVFTSTKVWGDGIKAPLPNEKWQLVNQLKIMEDTLTTYKNIESL